MLKPLNSYLWILSALLMLSANAQAFVAQNPRQAFVFDNFARGTVADPEAEKDTAADQYVPLEDSAVNYESIANKLLPKSEADSLYVDLRQRPTINVQAKPGQSFFVVLPEEDGSHWTLDSKLVEVVSSGYHNQKRILELRVLCCGKDSIFIDNIITASQKVAQSRILRLKVRK